MTATHHGNGHLNGNGRLVVEDQENLTFSVNRKVFVSDDVLEAEHRAIFDHCWIYVGHASELKQPGDFRTRQVAGRPVIFCRDRTGTVRALINSCRHRGALVCREREGNVQAQCEICDEPPTAIEHEHEHRDEREAREPGIDTHLDGVVA